MTFRIFLSDHGGDVEAFYVACYEAYLDFWGGIPTFQGLAISRHESLGDRNWEKTFWGIVEGHDPDRTFSSMERYEKIPCLKYIIESIISGDPDVKWYEIRRNGKIRVEIFSESHGFLVVLQKQSSKFHFITAHPLSQRQLKKKLSNYQEWTDNENVPL